MRKYRLMTTYSINEISEKLQVFPGWKLENGFLTRTFEFKSFDEAFGFMARVALISEKMNHHPNWSGGYMHVTINLRTHDADGITDKDFSFVEKIEIMQR
jgi:4a-hydroxytetrahydrobiopterin dehydratase